MDIEMFKNKLGTAWKNGMSGYQEAKDMVFSKATVVDLENSKTKKIEDFER